MADDTKKDSPKVEEKKDSPISTPPVPSSIPTQVKELEAKKDVSAEVEDAPLYESSLARTIDKVKGKRPSTSNPTPRVEPGRVESIGPQNLKNNVTEAKKAGLQLGGAEGAKQKEEQAKTVKPENPSIIK